jgi:hypothetical protein
MAGTISLGNEEEESKINYSGTALGRGAFSGGDYLPAGLFPTWTMYCARRIHRMP